MSWTTCWQCRRPRPQSSDACPWCGENCPTCHANAVFGLGSCPECETKARRAGVKGKAATLTSAMGALAAARGKTELREDTITPKVCPRCGFSNRGAVYQCVKCRKRLGTRLTVPFAVYYGLRGDGQPPACPRCYGPTYAAGHFCRSCNPELGRAEPAASFVEAACELSLKKCLGCGWINRDVARYCGRCGLSFSWTEPEAVDVLSANPTSKAGAAEKPPKWGVPCLACVGRGWVRERYRLLRRRRNYTCGRCKGKGTVWVTPPARDGFECDGVTSWLEGQRAWRHEWHYVPTAPPYGWKSAVQPPMGAKA